MMEKLVGGREPGSPEEIDGLQRRHQELERRLAVLDGHLALSAAEQAERARLKKEKLVVKDRILVLTASHSARPH
jgi:uncharacterized protein YdcH (DUF465 family)